MKTKKITTQQLVFTALFTALMCILGPLSLPIGPVPISLTNFVIYLAIMLLGMKLGTISCVVYLLLGAVGLPVFSGFSGGLGKLAGPTGGYLIGFIPMALIAGFAVSKWYQKMWAIVAGMLVGTLVLYAFGTVWFVILMKCEIWYALTICVFPFVLADLAKMVLAIVLGRTIKKRLAHLPAAGSATGEN